MKNNILNQKTENISEKKLDWTVVQSDMKNKFGKDIFESWIKKIEFVNEFSDYVLISVTTRFIRDWITSRYLDQILQIIKLYKKNVNRIEFIVKGELEINNFFSFLTAMMLAYQPIRSLATINMVLYSGAAGAKRVFAVLDEPILIANDTSLPKLEVKKSDIIFKDVSFKYDVTTEKAVSDINFEIKGGTMAAFVGHSGAGKSTIIKLIPRFYDPQKGNIFIDNQDIHSVNLESLRKNIALVSQDVILFDSSIKDNIAYANPSASDEEIVKACQFAAADDFINKMPNKYNTLIGENGVRLSGGQKQRISIARAVLKNSPIILLDEATSSLDAESEEKVQSAIKNLTKNKTTLVIAHRLSTIHNADKIFLVKNGMIIDSGNHQSLISSSEDYKSLYQRQLK